MLLSIEILFVIYCLLIVLSATGFLLTKDKKVSISLSTKAFSIIIPARNEAAHIIQCLESIRRNKRTPVFEIIVIDDFSEDETPVLVHNYFQQYPVGRLLKLSTYLQPEERINAFKKKAIEIAIEESKYEWIIQTDADCIVPQGWLHTIASGAEAPFSKFIAAPVSLLPVKGAWYKKILYWFQSIDFLTMQGITAATHYYGIGQMCNGANLAYCKSSFYEVGGFENIDHIASGDDMLLLHKFMAAFPGSARYLKSPHVIVQTQSQATWHDFLNQRIRWSSKADRYQDKRLTLILAIVYVFNFSIVILFILGIFDTNYLILALNLLIGKVGVEYLLVIPSAIFFKKAKQLIVFPLLQPLHICYIVLAGFLGKFGSYQWKNRTVK